MPERPPHDSERTVYSNINHELDAEAVTYLQKNPASFATHAAWDFCGYVWCQDDGQWVEQVWVHKVVVDTRLHGDLRVLISSVNEDYGER